VTEMSPGLPGHVIRASTLRIGPDRVARIRPATGEVAGWIDLDRLLLPGQVTDPEAVLNGIAYDAQKNRIFVTGKLWPRVFEITVK